jgi:hypothetical protein
MQKRIDAEDIAKSILDIMTHPTEGLNAYISAVDAEKTAKGMAFTPALKLVASAGYFYQSWNDKILNIDPAIFYGFEDVQAGDAGKGIAKTFKIFVEIVLVDNGMTNDVDRRVLRYSRALEELFADKFDVVNNSSRIKIETVRPMSMKVDFDSSDEVKVGGISISLSVF